MNRHTLTHTHCGHVGYYNKLASTNICPKCQNNCNLIYENAQQKESKHPWSAVSGSWNPGTSALI